MVQVWLRGREANGDRSSVYKDITAVCGAITLEGEVKAASRKLSFEVLRDKMDYFLSQVGTLERGDGVLVTDTGAPDIENAIFYGLVWRVLEDDASVQKQVTCYDNMRFLMTSDCITNVWTNVSPKEVTQTVCKELGVTMGAVPDVDVKVNVNARDRTGYEAIMIAWTEARKQTKKLYYPRMVGYKLSVIEKGEMLEGHDLKYQSQPLKGRLISVQKEEDSSEAVSCIYERSESGAIRYVESDKALARRYGYIVGVNDADAQSTKQEAVKVLGDGRKSVEVSAVGDWAVQTGWSVRLISNVLTADRLYIERDSHTFENGLHTMNLTLSYENEMEEVENQELEQSAGEVFVGAEGDGLATGVFGWPFAGGAGVITRGFAGMAHLGTDISTTGGSGAGSAVLACDGGVVVSAGDGASHWSYGNEVNINHGNGLFTRYAHLYRIDVAVGQRVSKGQQIGIEGNTGNSFGTHLHIEVHKGVPNGQRVDPMYYLRR